MCRFIDFYCCFRRRAKEFLHLWWIIQSCECSDCSHVLPQRKKCIVRGALNNGQQFIPLCCTHLQFRHKWRKRPQNFLAKSFYATVPPRLVRQREVMITFKTFGDSSWKFILDMYRSTRHQNFWSSECNTEVHNLRRHLLCWSFACRKKPSIVRVVVA